MTVTGNLVVIYKGFVTSAMVAFLPLMGAVIGIFIAFAVANQLRYFIMKMK